MSLDPALLAMLTQTITHAPLLGRDAYGVPAYALASGVSYPARVSMASRRFRNADGSEVVAALVAHIALFEPVSPDDAFVLPDGSQPKVVRVHQPVDETGRIHHTQVFFG